MIDTKLFVVPKPALNPKLRLFCFPYAGGSIRTYMTWCKHFNSDVEVVLVQPPGRGDRFTEPAHENMTPYIAELMQYASYITDIPYVFFGHSLGSRVAFELSCKLKLLNMSLPVYFIASGSRAPHMKNKNASLYALPDNEFMEQLKKLNGTPKEVLANSELMEVLLPLLRADFNIADNYKANKVCMPFPILTLHGEKDHSISTAQACAWRELSSAHHKLIKLPGDHFFINQNQADVLKIISPIVNNALHSITEFSNSDEF